MVFFSLSGFFIHLRAAKQFATEHRIHPLNNREFARRRLHRLAVPYFFVLALTFGLDSIGQYFFPSLYLGHTDNALLNENFSAGNYSARAVLPATVMLPRSLDVTFGSNGPLWSLAYEVIYYALYPVWLNIRRHSRSVAYLGIPGICLLLGGFTTSTWITGVLSHWPIWIAGAGLAEIMMRSNERHSHQVATSQENAGESRGPYNRLRSRNAFCRIGITLAGAGFIGCQITDFPIGILLCYSALGSGTVLTFCTFPPKIESMRTVSCWKFLGIRSYTIYILHFPILTLIASSFYVDGGPPSEGWLAVAAAMVTLLICVAAFERCERYFVHPRISIERGSESK